MTKSENNNSKNLKTKTKKAVKNSDLKGSDNLLEQIVEGIREKKGLDIVYIDLKKINSSICDYFVICHGTSGTQVKSIAESIEDTVRKNIGVKPAWREGLANAEWVLLDYMDVVVHIFQEDVRNFYQLEALWADAPINKMNSD